MKRKIHLQLLWNLLDVMSDVKSQIYQAKKKLAKTDYLITESLTFERLQMQCIQKLWDLRRDKNFFLLDLRWKDTLHENKRC